MRDSKYEHIKCDECGGIIGSYDRGDNYTCERCNKNFDLHKLKYDTIMTNPNTGWIFPMIES